MYTNEGKKIKFFLKWPYFSTPTFFPSLLGDGQPEGINTPPERQWPGPMNVGLNIFGILDAQLPTKKESLG